MTIIHKIIKQSIDCIKKQPNHSRERLNELVKNYHGEELISHLIRYEKELYHLESDATFDRIKVKYGGSDDIVTAFSKE
uniref:Uncharacterized protein n=1 Tax=viral metagenome TaxID=1070528 RepID=A0A6M3MAZ6_9ZZZZ